MKKALGVISLAVNIAFMVWASKNFGSFGFCLSICIVAVSGIRFGAYMGLYNLPAPVKKITAWVLGIAISVLVIMWLWKTIPEVNEVKSWGAASTNIPSPFFVYDLTKEKIVSGKVLSIKYYKDKTIGINLPIGNYSYTWELESDTMTHHPLCGGKPQKDGPGKQVIPPCNGNAGRLIQVTGLEGNGVMKITLDPLRKKRR